MVYVNKGGFYRKMIIFEMMQKVIHIFIIGLLLFSGVAFGQAKLDKIEWESLQVSSPQVINMGEPTVSTYQGPVLVKPGSSNNVYVDDYGNEAKRKLKLPNEIEFDQLDYALTLDEASVKYFNPNKFIGNPDTSLNNLVVAEQRRALPPRYKEEAVVDIKHYDIEQGLNNSYIYDFHKCKSGFLWMASNGGGLIRFDGEHFNFYMKEHGLHSNMVQAIDPDEEGNLWLATLDGVSKFNGKNFRNYTTEHGLNSNLLKDILVDSRGRIWIATENKGLNMIDGIHIYSITKEIGLANHIQSLYEDYEGNIWIGTYKNGAYCYDGIDFRHFTEKHGLKSNFVRDINGNEVDEVYFGTNEGLTVLKKNKILNYSEEQGLPNSSINVVYADSVSGILLGTNGAGMCRISEGVVICLNKNHGLSNNEVWAIKKDQGGIFWIGTWGGGLNRYDGFMFIHYKKTHGMPAELVPAIAINSKKNLWFGSFGNGIFEFKDGKFYQYAKEQGFKPDAVWSMLFDNSDYLWLASNNRGLWKQKDKKFYIYNKSNGLPSNSIWSLLEDKKGNIWFGTDKQGVIKFDGEKFLRAKITQNMIISLFEDSKGNIWASTWGDGIYKIKDNQYLHFDKESGFAPDKIYNIFEDELGYIWVATSGDGIFIYNGNRFEDFTKKNGLSSNIIYWIKQINEQRIVIGTENGLNELVLRKKSQPSYPDSNFIVEEVDSATQKRIISFDNRQYELKSYGINEGFTGLDCIGSQFSAIVVDSSSMWIGTGKQLTNYNPAYNFKDTVPPKIHLKAVNLFLQPVDWVGMFTEIQGNRQKRNKIYFDSLDELYGLPINLQLPHNQNHLSFDFVGINWKEPQKTLYQYRLMGLEENWNYPTQMSHAIYSNLSPGEYTFEIRAMNSYNYWSKPYQYHFIIKTPWWQTLWFQLGIIVVAVFIVIGLIKWRVRALKEQKEMLEKMVQERTQEIMQQKEEIMTQRDNLNQANAQLERLSIVARETHNGVLIADHRGNIEWINEGYTNLLGYSLEELRDKVGINLFFVYSDENSLGYLTRCRDKKEPVTFTSQYEKQGGNYLWLQTTITPILDDNGKMRKYVVIYADVTSLKFAQSQIEKHNKEITSSIRYASRIQSSVLPLRQQIDKAQMESFIIYKPKDIVGGDFYWFSKHKENYLAGVIDCTGHGVPGAFMTVIAYSAISRIINDSTANNPAKILQLTNKNVRELLKQQSENHGNSDDGLDASFCYIMPEQKKLKFAGAKQDLLHLWSDEIIEIKGDRQSIGYTTSNEAFVYTNHLIDIRYNSIFYLASDGYKDMSVDSDGHIMGKKRFRELLGSLGGKSMVEQQHYLQNIMYKSLQHSEQHDDITIFAFKLPESLYHFEEDQE